MVVFVVGVMMLVEVVIIVVVVILVDVSGSDVTICGQGSASHFFFSKNGGSDGMVEVHYWYPRRQLSYIAGGS